MAQFHHGPQKRHAGVAGWLRRGAGDPFDACYRVTRADQGGHANCMACYTHHLRDARKRPGADARRAGRPAGLVPAFVAQTCATSANNCAAVNSNATLASTSDWLRAKGCNTHNPSAPLR